MNPIEKMYLKITDSETRKIKISIKKELIKPILLLITLRIFIIFFNI